MDTNFTEILQEERRAITNVAAKTAVQRVIRSIGQEHVTLQQLVEMASADKDATNTLMTTPVLDFFPDLFEDEEVRETRQHIRLSEQDNATLTNTVASIIKKKKKGYLIGELVDLIREKNLPFVFTLNHVRHVLNALSSGGIIQKVGNRKNMYYTPA